MPPFAGRQAQYTSEKLENHQEWAKGSTKMNTLYLSETCFRVQAFAGQPDVAGVCSCAIENKQ